MADCSSWSITGAWVAIPIVKCARCCACCTGMKASAGKSWCRSMANCGCRSNLQASGFGGKAFCLFRLPGAKYLPSPKADARLGFAIAPLTLAADESKFARSGESEGMAKTTRRVGVVLFQLGGPDTLAAIEPFLYNLFCDPDIIDFP